MHYNCLIVDDEKPLAENTAKYFNMFGISTTAVFDAKSCLTFLEENSVDLLLLDINLEESSGFDLCCELRETMQMPILFISARQSDDDILLALQIGGDDYIRKPYTLSILLAKVKAVLKRCIAPEETVYKHGRLMLDFTAGRVFLNEEALRLKAMEYKLLCYLVKNRGRIISKDELFSKVWKDHYTSDGTLNVHIRYLREQIEEDPNNPVYIQTVWGTGYIFEEPKL